MEGDGPARGIPVDHRICVVSPDWPDLNGFKKDLTLKIRVGRSSGES